MRRAPSLQSALPVTRQSQVDGVEGGFRSGSLSCGQARGLVTISMSSSRAEPWTTTDAIPRKSFIASASD